MNKGVSVKALLLILVSPLAFATIGFDPANEGVFKGKLTCIQVLPNQPCEKDKQVGVVIANLGSHGGVVVSVNDQSLGVQYFQMLATGIENEGALLQGSGERFGRSAEFKIEIQSAKRTLAGWISDYDRGFDWRVEATLQDSASELYVSSPTPVSAEDILGVYKGTIAGTSGKLVIRKKLLSVDQGLAASWITDVGTTSGFPIVEVVPWAGLVHLMRIEKDYFLKWTLSYRRTDKGVRWVGKGFSAVKAASLPLAFEN